MQVFDPFVLRDLAGDVGGWEPTLHVVDRFRSLLPVRIHRLSTALADDDELGALDVTLSIKVTAAIVGGHAVSTIAARLELDLRRVDLVAARQSALPLPRAARDLERDLALWVATRKLRLNP